MAGDLSGGIPHARAAAAAPYAATAGNARARGGLSLLRAASGLAPLLARVGPLRRPVIAALERALREDAAAEARTGALPPRVCEDRLAARLALARTLDGAAARGRFGGRALRRGLEVLAGGPAARKDAAARSAFRERHGAAPPGFLLVSPTRFCNLLCRGCCSDGRGPEDKLEFAILDRMVGEARDLWGARFVVLSGGEPLAYRDAGRDVLDLAAAHPGTAFLLLTNGTLLDDRAARRVARLGNVIPALAVEGLRERTDRRRGKGVFERVTSAMERLRRERAPFGISLTASRENADEVLADPAVDFYFGRMGALFAAVFQYMPMGRGFAPGLMPSPEQRLRLWRRSWQLVRERGLLVGDAWTAATLAQGCFAAGRAGGYLAVDATGGVQPCAFMPYSPVNVRTAYARGQTLDDVWAHPFFARVRGWQADYGYGRRFAEDGPPGNWLRPCPVRDHYREFHHWLESFDTVPADEHAAAASLDPEYRRGMLKYGRALAELFDPIWDRDYAGRAPGPEPPDAKAGKAPVN